jgi:hypothetical protein
MTAPDISENVARQFAGQLVREATRGRVLALKGDPERSFGGDLRIGDHTVAVVPCVSALAVREALSRRTPDDFTVIITDRPREDLGETLVSRFRGQSIKLVNPWDTVAQLFQARRVDAELRHSGQSVAEALVRSAPASGYPVAQAEIVTRDLALRSLAEQVLQVQIDAVAGAGLLSWTRDPAARERWKSQPSDVRQVLTGWAGDALGLVAQVALDIANSDGLVDGITVGLAADVMWPEKGQPPFEAAEARSRAEKYLGGRSLTHSEARQLADAARGVVLRMGPEEGRGTILLRAQELLSDVGWADGARRSTLLPLGYEERQQQFARALNNGVEVERSFEELLDHEAALAERRRDTQRAQMAVRLWRWLQIDAEPEPKTLADAMARQIAADGWVDFALGEVSAGSNDELLASAYARLCGVVMERRRAHDLQFAALLASATAREAELDGVVPLESLVADTVKPLSQQVPVLLVVVDGMSAAVACELGESCMALGWQEMVPAGAARSSALAVLPTVTKHSRTSLFAGELTTGTQADEKRLFNSVFGATVFHKDDLRAGAGEALPPAVRQAIAGEASLVAVVLNTVDDTLAKHDPDGTAWTVDAVQHLPALLDLADAAGRAVVLVSDHGHVVERGTAARPVAGADNRWRSADTGEVADDEVLLAGRRVQEVEGTIVAAAVEGLRYARKSAGYHGGATAAEATVPVVVLARDPAALGATWQAAPPQAPAWWFDAVASQTVAPVTLPPAPGVLFDTVPTAPDPDEELAAAVVASSVYTDQQARAGRHALPADLVTKALRTLLAGGGRAHRETMARALGVSVARFNGYLSVLKRLLNVEGYEVLSLDADGHTLLLDVDLMKTQFGVS